jgi:uncharacterized protein DUF2804
MPIMRAGRLRKRWRYVGVYAEQMMFCVALVQIGPLRQSFWALWDREGGRLLTRTRLRPGVEVIMDGSEVGVVAPEIKAHLWLGDGAPVEAVCSSGERGYGWTRKRAGIPVSGTIEAAGRRWQLDARGVDDESAGYHQRHTSWHWSAGVGRAADGRALAWNLVEGINDPPQRSERAIWLNGEPHEPAPVSFSGLEAIEFARGARLGFEAGSERARNDNLLLIRSRYRHLFGTFRGSLDGVELERGLGVMEKHEAVW